MIGHTVVIVQKVEILRSRIKRLDNISLIIMVKRNQEISFCQYKINQLLKVRNLYPLEFQQFVCISWSKVYPGDRISRRTHSDMTKVYTDFGQRK